MHNHGFASINRHWCASSDVTIIDTNGGFEGMYPQYFSVRVTDEAKSVWFGKVLAVNTKGTVLKLRVTAPRCFPSAEFPDSGTLHIELKYGQHEFKICKMPVYYVDDNGWC
ncbi:MAG TPA: hypothetical protein VGZ47_14605 [Gemmataceae bacterium]|jgi:hypothetical protein|nr:hypothetical protein [Gemmataceae bacterium]